MNDNKSAFPVFDGRGGADYECIDSGITARQYAAIHLKVPRSGDPEIDAMIRESRKAEFAGQALAGITAKVYKTKDYSGSFMFEDIADEAQIMANALLAEWEEEAGK